MGLSVFARGFLLNREDAKSAKEEKKKEKFSLKLRSKKEYD